MVAGSVCDAGSGDSSGWRRTAAVRPGGPLLWRPPVLLGTACRVRAFSYGALAAGGAWVGRVGRDPILPRQPGSAAAGATRDGCLKSVRDNPQKQLDGAARAAWNRGLEQGCGSSLEQRLLEQLTAVTAREGAVGARGEGSGSRSSRQAPGAAKVTGRGGSAAGRRGSFSKAAGAAWDGGCRSSYFRRLWDQRRLGLQKQPAMVSAGRTSSFGRRREQRKTEDTGVARVGCCGCSVGSWETAGAADGGCSLSLDLWTKSRAARAEAAEAAAGAA